MQNPIKKVRRYASKARQVIGDTFVKAVTTPAVRKNKMTPEQAERARKTIYPRYKGQSIDVILKNKLK